MILLQMTILSCAPVWPATQRASDKAAMNFQERYGICTLQPLDAPQAIHFQGKQGSNYDVTV